ncbi:MAG: hypothetical protein ACXWRE_07565 [Pseudobdellovibrionaceae bacterium]
MKHFTSLLTVGFLIQLYSASTMAAVISLQDCSQSQVQAAIDSSQNGDTVVLPSGNCTWSSAVTIPSAKGLTLNGNGASISGQIVLNQNNLTSSRITGFKFTSANAIYAQGSNDSAPFRIDNNVFTVNASGILIELGGNAPGLIDHNQFNAPTNSEMIHNYGMGAVDSSGWSDDVIPGSPNAIYIESNSFINNGVSGNPAYFWGNSAVQSYYGARTVFRYNSLSMSEVDQHGTPGMIGARWWEIYENTFDVVLNGNQSQYMQIRAGSGVIFNNHKTGYDNQGSGTIELVEEDSGYPALYQIGRGKNQVLDPAYVWGNDTSMNVGSGSSNVQLNRDYYESVKPNYKPFSFPYPLTANGMPNMSGSQTSSSPSPLAAPVNLRVVP